MKARRSDGNQATLVEQMRKIGLSVFVTSRVGQGFPDVVAGKGGNKNFLFEIKDPKQPPSKRALTFDEQLFFDTWKGQVHLVETIDEVIKIVNACQ